MAHDRISFPPPRITLKGKQRLFFRCVIQIKHKATGKVFSVCVFVFSCSSASLWGVSVGICLYMCMFVS